MSKGGPSIVITADQHDATRRARKAAQRRNHGTGRRVADGTDILTLARQDRIMRAREAREAELHAEHVALIAYLESTIRSMRLMGTNASTTEIVQMTIDGFLTEFDRADPKAYKALGMTRTHYVCDRVRSTMRDLYGDTRRTFVDTTLAICRRVVADSRERRLANA